MNASKPILRALSGVLRAACLGMGAQPEGKLCRLEHARYLRPPADQLSCRLRSFALRRLVTDCRYQRLFFRVLNPQLLQVILRENYEKAASNTVFLASHSRIR